MNQFITENQMDDVHLSLPINYKGYKKWLDDDLNSRIKLCSSSIVDIRPRNDWDKKGREIYNSQKMSQHAQIVSQLIEFLSCRKFLVEHEYKSFPWVPNYKLKSSLSEKYSNFLTVNFGNEDYKKVIGAFLFEHDFKFFLNAFIDYPFLLKYKDIDCFSFEHKMVVKITHHLTIDFVVWNNDLLKKITTYLTNAGLTVAIKDAPYDYS